MKKVDAMAHEAPEDWRPTCDTTVLKLRATMLAAIRAFFVERDYLEVETPLLSHDIVVDAHLDPFEVRQGQDEHLFLQTSPEAGMKRLLASGSGSIFQITKSFRRDETGTRHNPEFTMVEWYGLGTTYHEQMQLTEQLVRHVAANLKAVEATGQQAASVELSQQPFAITQYDEVFQTAIGHRVLDLSTEKLQEIAAGPHRKVDELDNVSRDDLLNLILAEKIESKLGKPQPEFVCDFPLSQAALAEQSTTDPRTARRFELYAGGLELCNGYQELTDTVELQRRDESQNSNRSDHGVNELPGAKRMMAAMNAGLPQCSGVALGFDRLLMYLIQTQEIQGVIPFPIDRA